MPLWGGRMKRIGGLIGLAFVAATQPVHGQELGPFSIGMSFVQPRGAPDQPYLNRAVTDEHGNHLALTVDNKTGRVVYLEADWNQKPEGAVSDVPGMTFGKTTLDEIRAAMGSNGFAYNGAPTGRTQDGAIVLSNAYEIDKTGGVVAVFVTRVSPERARAAQGQADPKPGQLALLDAVILADPAYLAQLWDGKFGRPDPTYKPAPWPKAKP